MDETNIDSFKMTPNLQPSNFVIEFVQNVTKLQDENTTIHECRVCKKTFYNKLALQNHTKLQHDAESSYSENEQCQIKNEDIYADVCDFKFVPLNKTEDQIIEENGVSKRVFGVDTSYLLVKVEGEDDIISAKRSRLDGVLRRTQNRPQKPPVDLRGPFTCTLPSTLRPDTQCHQIFFNCCEYSLHYREKHTKRRKAALRCQVCEKRLDRSYASSLTLPPQLNLTNNITFSCRLCGQVFLDSTRYDEHNRIMHPKMKPHQCSICAKRFTQQGGLQQHMRMHTGIRPFVCSFCSKSFTQKAGLDQHLRTHTKIKPFKCVICSKCFSQSVHLRQHMRTHTNIQPFECPVCGRRFKQSSHLNFHMRSHVGDTNGLLMEQYNQAVEKQNQMNFMNFSNVQPVQDGETIYYSAELASMPETYQNSMAYRQITFFGNNAGK